VKCTRVARGGGCDWGRDIIRIKYLPKPTIRADYGRPCPTPVLPCTSSFYFFPSTAARHFPYSSSKCAAYSSGFDAEPVP
jgi:hypothetical protein